MESNSYVIVMIDFGSSQIRVLYKDDARPLAPELHLKLLNPQKTASSVKNSYSIKYLWLLLLLIGAKLASASPDGSDGKRHRIYKIITPNDGYWHLVQWAIGPSWSIKFLLTLLRSYLLMRQSAFANYFDQGTKDIWNFLAGWALPPLSNRLGGFGISRFLSSEFSPKKYFRKFPQKIFPKKISRKSKKGWLSWRLAPPYLYPPSLSAQRSWHSSKWADEI